MSALAQNDPIVPIEKPNGVVVDAHHDGQGPGISAGEKGAREMVPVVHPMATLVVGAEDTEVGQGGEGFGWPGCLSQAGETILRDGADGLVVERLVKADEPVPAAPCDSENLLAVAIPDGVAAGNSAEGKRLGTEDRANPLKTAPPWTGAN